MKKYLFIYLALMTYILKAQENIQVDVNYGTDIVFGVDQIEKIYDNLPQILKFIKPIKYKDYEEFKISDNTNNNEITQNNVTFVPNISGKEKDIRLTLRYLSQSIILNKIFSTNISVKNLGLNFGVYLKGVDLNYTNFNENYDFKIAKLNFRIDNKYLKANLNKYIKGNKEDTLIEKVRLNENFNNLDYYFSIDPFSKYNTRIGLDISGVDKSYQISPVLNYSNNGFFLNAGVVFDKGVKNFDIDEEIYRIKHTAPGYDKVEYFKKWTLKKELPDLSNKEKYFEDKVDLNTAEISGYKGTKRIQGAYSGSLYGDNPVTYFNNKLREKINKNRNLIGLNSMIEKVEQEKFSILDLTNLLDFLNIFLEKDKYKYEFENILNEISFDIYKKVGYDKNKKYNSQFILNQIQDEFKNVLPGINPNFKINKVNKNLFDRDYLYFKGLKPNYQTKDEDINKLLKISNRSVKPDYILVEKEKDMIYDAKNHLVANFKKEYDFKEIKDFTQKILSYNSSEIIKNSFKIISFIRSKPLFSQAHKILQDPARELKNIDMLRGIYFHNSEKKKNEEELEEILLSMKPSTDNLIFANLPYFKFNIGKINDNYSIILNTNFNKYFKATNDEMIYARRTQELNLNININYKGLLFNNDIDFKYLAHNLTILKDKKGHFEYDTFDLNTRTYLGYTFNPNNKWYLNLGLNHIGKYGYIVPKKIIINDKEYEKDIAYRDKNKNPIGKDGKVIIVKEKTEFNLIDSAAKLEEYNKISNRKRLIKASDFIKTEKENAVSSIYRVNNILSPKIELLYKPSKSFEIKNEINLPISFVDDKISGINFVYTNNIKYIINKSLVDSFIEKNPIKFNLNGNLELGSNLGTEKKEAYAKYSLLLNSSPIYLKFKGINNKTDLLTEINPLIFDINFRPKIIFEINDKEYRTNFVVESNTNENFIAQFGASKLIKNRENLNDFSKKITNEVFLENEKRTDNEKLALEYLYKKIDLNKNLEYRLTPYFHTRKNKGDLKYSLKYKSKLGSYENEKSDYKEEQTEAKYDLDNFDGNYIGGTSYIDGWFSGHAIYFKSVDKKSEKSFYDILSKEKIKYINHDLVYNLNYKKNGIYLSNDFDFDFSSLNYENNEETKIRTVEIIEKNIFGLENHSKKPFKKEDIKEENRLKLSKEEKENEKNLDKFLENVSAKSQIAKSKRKKYSFFKDKNKVLNAMKEDTIKENEKSTENIVKTSKLHTKSINVNFDTKLGYIFEVNNKLQIKPSISHNLNLKYLKMENLYINEIKLFGDEKIIILNTLSPNLGIKYNIYKGLSFKTKAQLPIFFENKNYKKLGFNLNTSFEYKF